MNRQVMIAPPVSQALGRFGLSRALLLRVLATLRSELEDDARHDRRRRDLEDPDGLFLHRIRLADQTHWHTFDFVIDDATSSDIYLVKGVAHIARPSGG